MGHELLTLVVLGGGALVGRCDGFSLFLGVWAKVQGWPMMGKRGSIASESRSANLVDCSTKMGQLL